ncbi:MAG: hypothetical protein IJU75_03280 [Clostridia bacterium]|nr:hypothetical protein [Clostridia bacterium]
MKKTRKAVAAVVAVALIASLFAIVAGAASKSTKTVYQASNFVNDDSYAYRVTKFGGYKISFSNKYEAGLIGWNGGEGSTGMSAEGTFSGSVWLPSDGAQATYDGTWHYGAIRNYGEPIKFNEIIHGDFGPAWWGGDKRADLSGLQIWYSDNANGPWTKWDATASVLPDGSGYLADDIVCGSYTQVIDYKGSEITAQYIVVIDTDDAIATTQKVSVMGSKLNIVPVYDDGKDRTLYQYESYARTGPGDGCAFRLSYYAGVNVEPTSGYQAGLVGWDDGEGGTGMSSDGVFSGKVWMPSDGAQPTYQSPWHYGMILDYGASMKFNELFHGDFGPAWWGGDKRTDLSGLQIWYSDSADGPWTKWDASASVVASGDGFDSGDFCCGSYSQVISFTGSDVSARYVMLIDSETPSTLFSVNGSVMNLVPAYNASSAPTGDMLTISIAVASVAILGTAAAIVMKKRKED